MGTPWARAPRTLIGLSIALGVLAVSTAVVGVVLVSASAVDDPGRELGKWFLQLALVFAGTGVVSAVVRQYEVVRAQRDAWLELLHLLVAAHDDVQMAARLLSAHATAKTYAEQITVMTSARASLRRLASTPEIQDDEELHDALVTMRKYLKYIIKEYQAKYLSVARQQRLDEAVLTFRLGTIAKSDEPGFPQLPVELAQPLPAGVALQDPHLFPLLNEFRTGFKTSRFRDAYAIAKPSLQKRAGLPPDKPPTAAPPPAAQEAANDGRRPTQLEGP